MSHARQGIHANWRTTAGEHSLPVVLSGGPSWRAVWWSVVARATGVGDAVGTARHSCIAASEHVVRATRSAIALANSVDQLSMGGVPNARGRPTGKSPTKSGKGQGANEH